MVGNPDLCQSGNIYIYSWFVHTFFDLLSKISSGIKTSEKWWCKTTNYINIQKRRILEQIVHSYWHHTQPRGRDAVNCKEKCVKKKICSWLFKKYHINASKRQRSHASEISTGREKQTKKWQRDKRCCRCCKQWSGWKETIEGHQRTERIKKCRCRGKKH